jgi:hypothetical protein
MITLSLERILIDGALLSLGMSIIIFGSLYLNPRLWLQDYPPEIRAVVPPLTPHEKRAQRLLMLPFMLVMLGIPLYSTYLLRVANGGTISFLSAYLNIAAILNIFNLFDALVIDFLILTLMKPKFATLPGTEGMEHLYTNLPLQLRNYLKGIVVVAVLSLPLALIATL